MPQPDIHIGRIQLELRGIPPDVARAAVASLDTALPRAIAAQTAGRAPGTHVPQVAAPPLRVPSNASVTMLSQALAEHLAATIGGTLVRNSNRT